MCLLVSCNKAPGYEATKRTSIQSTTTRINLPPSLSSQHVVSHSQENKMDRASLFPSVFRAATGENWHYIMLACGSEALCTQDAVPKEKPGATCGSDITYLYFISFVFLCSFLVSQYCAPVVPLSETSAAAYFSLDFYFCRLCDDNAIRSIYIRSENPLQRVVPYYLST